MNYLRFVIVVALVALISYTGYNFLQQHNEIKREIVDLSSVTNKLKAENAELEKNIEYYSLPENVLKASKAQFNYRNEGEQMIIVIPSSSSSTSSTQ
jgi:cell division protein FtsB